jgi:hypothetical protein
MTVKALFVWAYTGGFLWLAGWELAAFAVSSKYTISDLTWQFEGPGWTAGRFFVLAALVWLTLHLAFGWLR